MHIAAKLDEWGKGAWIAAMIVGFVVFWPIGLAILIYMNWSGRMGCRNYYWDESMKNEFRQRRQEMRDEWRARRDEWKSMKRAWRDEMKDRWHSHQRAAETSGNAAFDDYKAETLRRLEEEQAEFSDFLGNLRKARDKAEFDQFMKSRKTAPESEPVSETAPDHDRPDSPIITPAPQQASETTAPDHDRQDNPTPPYSA